MSRDCLWVAVAAGRPGWVCVCVSVCGFAGNLCHKRCFIYLFWGIARNNIHVEIIGLRFHKKIATFANNLLIVTRDESPLVYRAPESASEHSHFGPLPNIVISGHVISGQARFGTAQLHYLKLLCTGSSHGKSVQAPIRL